MAGWHHQLDAREMQSRMPPRVLIWMENRLEGKGCRFGRAWFQLSVGPSGDGGQEEKGTTEDEMAGWHH